ncbi:glycosyltransferase [Lentzea flava]|uniref:Glycosyl transferase n=1 Tax=Lentzea flava TaxID=103732 RepID=A0ABQ2UD40_9PSEU|nr:glycosyltransferase [Lentzea flava]MCP2196756.1 Glycosyltransferase involved in cell wall bisynthesis [Lentzea flava]GGU15743.1 glycosyl transferase [Lentzea flava]
MRVLHIITGLDVGGAELQVRMLLQHSRHDGEVLTLYNPATVAAMITADGGRVRDLGMRRNTQLSAVPRLARLLWSERFDVVHVHLYRACVYGRTAAWLARTPVVVTSEHSIGETHIERRPMTLGVRALYLATDLFSDVTVAVSDTVRQRLVRWGVPARKIVTIPNGLEFGDLAFDPAKRAEARQRLGIAQNAFVVGVMGRLDAAKRIDLAIRAAAPLLGETRKMLIVGQGADRERLEGVAAAAGVAGHVIFAGYQADGVAMLSALDLYVSTSAQETFGLSVLEALANGMPALFTACPALDGIVTDRARQVPDAVPELRDEIAKEIDAWPRPRQSVPEVVDRYGIASVAARIDGLYESLARRRQLLRREIPGARDRERDHANAQ